MQSTDENKTPAPAHDPSEIERLKEELRREHDLHLRALADFDNYRRRVERERGATARSGKRDVILSFLDVLDGFDRALAHLGDTPSSLSEGLRALHRKALGVLEAHGVTPIESLGETFNPELHDAVGSVESDEYESGTVGEEVQRGYRWGDDDLLRPARVRVAR
jgi:molecular chaperone GrpE